MPSEGAVDEAFNLIPNGMGLAVARDFLRGFLNAESN